MKYPALIINESKLADNIRTIQRICAEYPISFCAVTKCFCALPRIVDIYYNLGVREFADTRIPNLKKIAYHDARRWLLRLPMLCEVEDVVKYADVSLNSELETVAALSETSLRLLGMKHRVILMVDVGDLREGVLPEDAVRIAGEMLKFEGIRLLGLGVNFNCFGGLIPNPENVSIILDIRKEIEMKYDTRLPVLSGGNSGSIHMLTNRTMPKGVNYLRLGEIFFLGHETSYQQRIGNMHENVFRLEAQIIEIQKKPSKPTGELGRNAFGEVVTFEDKGDMIRAIIACGRQDVDMKKIVPYDTDTEVIGQSSDHTIIDVTHSKKEYKVGDALSFSLSYGSLLSLSTSKYVHKLYE